MRWINMLLLAALPSLVAPAPAAAQVQGTYRLMQLEGQALPAPSPDEDNVTVHAAALILAEDGRYTFQLSASGAAQALPETHQATGSYRVEGDTLFLEMDDTDEPIPLTFLLEEGRLTLTVPAGYAYTFQRQ
jgi:hypothetical protein